MPNNPSNKIKSESVDEVIIRLLGLNPGVELDYQTYFEIIKKKLAISRLAGKELPREEDELLREELKRVRKEKDKGIRFKVKKGKTKVSSKGSEDTFKDQKSLPSSGALVKSPKEKLSAKDVISVNVKDITENISKISQPTESSNFDQIKKTLDSIIEILKSKFKLDQKQSDNERREKESEKRSKKESTLEGFKKGVAGIVSATKKMLSPFQSIIDRIMRFIFFTLLGRAFTKFMEWLNDKGNQEKFNSFIEFLSKHWPALAGLYILFGTSFGKLVRGLLKGVARMTVALIMNIGKIKKFISKNKKLAFLGLAIAPLASRELGNIFGENKETPESGLIPKTGMDLGDAKKDVDTIKTQEVPKYNLGGMIPKFNLGGMIPTFNIGGINSFPLGMDFASGVPISGAGQDDTLIAAKTGEAILTEKDQQDIGKRYIDRETGQPLNIPQYLAGRKPGKVSMGNLKFPGMIGGGFFNGGMIPKFNVGGIIGNKNKTQNPKISPADYHSLLAISALEDDKPQGRADVAQSLYNRILAAQKYKVNFNQSGNSLKHLITAPDQYQPVFSNRNDWLNITDRNSAAIAIMNSEKGKKNKWTIKDALKQLSDTESALKNPELQSLAQKHVGGRAYFLGTSQQANMKPGDVLRDEKHNFFSPWYLEGTPYDKQRRNVAAPIPEMLLPKNAIRDNKRQAKPKPKSKQSLFGSIVGGIQSGFQSIMNMGRGAVAKPQKKMGGGLIVGENDGVNIPGATADRQLFPLIGGGSVALHPGEGIVPRDVIYNMGGEKVFNQFIATFESGRNSNAAKMGYAPKNLPPIKPYSQDAISSMVTLPPITAGSSGMRPRASGLSGGSEVPGFSARHPNGMHYKYAEIYGIMAG